MAPVLGRLLVVALLAGISAVAASCGDGEEALPAEEYFQQLQSISSELDDRVQTLDSEYEAALGSETGSEVDVEAIQSILDEGASAFRDALDAVESLDPPSGVEDAHREFLQEARARTELLESYASRAGEAESPSELEAAFAEFDDPNGDAMALRFAAACEALETIAADQGIQVDLNCE